MKLLIRNLGKNKKDIDLELYYGNESEINRLLDTVTKLHLDSNSISYADGVIYAGDHIAGQYFIEE